MENRAAEIKKMISHKHIIVKVRPLQHSGTISTQANVIRLHRPLDVPRSCQVEILYLLHAAISRNIAQQLINTIEDTDDLASIIEIVYLYMDMGYPEAAKEWIY